MLQQEYRDDAIKIYLTGFIKLMGEMENYPVRSQIRSFIIAFIVVTPRLWDRCARPSSPLSMIPNFTPIFVGLGIMPSQHPARPRHHMIGSIALGLVVDDTVHFGEVSSKDGIRSFYRVRNYETVLEAGARLPSQASS